MENRLPLRDTRRLPSFAPSDIDYDEDYRYSRSEDSVRFAADNIQPVQENVFSTPPDSPRPSNVFATPVHSRSPSPTDLDRGDSGESTLAPSVYSLRRDSSFTSRRSSSPIRVANGGYFPQHRVSSSLAPSIISNSSGHPTGSGLHRSNTVATNTTNTTNSSTLYSIPSQLSQFSSPPSPLPSIAPVRPRFDYGGHQQSIYPLSVHSNSDIGEHDPFGDGFEIPVGDGFAPHHHRQPPSIASTEPPPYSMYPDQPPPKPEERGIAADVQSNPDSGFSIGEDADDRSESRMVILAPVGGQAVGVNGGGPDNLDDGSGAAKEWKEKRWLGIKARVIILGFGIGLMVLLAVGLGVGLGVGLRKSSSTSVPVTSISFPTTVAEMPPSSEETGPPISDPYNIFPDIETGMAVLKPLVLSEISSDCALERQDRSSPGYFDMGSGLLWSCQNSPDKPLVWKFDHFPPNPSRINMSTFPSHPEFLMGAEYDEGSWGGYMLSSLEGMIKFGDGWDMVVKDDNSQEEYSAKPGWRDGAQNPLFWHIPLAYYNTSTTINKPLKLRSNNSTPVGKFANYKFGILYNKTVVLKQNTIDQTLAVHKSTGGPPKFANGTALGESEIVWKCVWEKTLLDVEISINQPSLARRPTGSGGDRGPPSNRDGDGGLGYGRGSGGGFSDDRGGPLSGSPSGVPPGPPGGPSPQNSFNTGNSGQFEPPATALAIPTPTGLNDSVDSTDGAYKFSDIPIAGKIKRGESPSPYPLKITIQETRPSPKRLRRVIGMDLTDADPRGDGKPGDVKCTRMVVTRFGGLKEVIDPNGEGLVILRERGPPPWKRDPAPGECSCRWTS